MSLLSIIIPVYNVERYLSTCLDSVVQQLLTDYEVILVDDGSTDGSGRICDEYAARHTEFRVIHQENKGLSITRNLGVAEAKGKYLMFLDSDDYLVSESIAGLLCLAEANNLDVLGFRFADVTTDCKTTLIKQQETPEYVEVTTGFEYIAHNNYVAQIWWYIIRRDLIVNNNILFPVGHMLEDAAFNVRVFSKAQRMAQVPNVVYCYRYRPESVMHNRDKEHQQQLLWDYLYAAHDIGCVLKEVGNEMNEDCYNRCCSRRDSYVFFGAIRAFKLGLVREFIDKAKAQNLYPFKLMSKKDYPKYSYSIIYWCISRPTLWKALSSVYRLIQ